MSYSLIGKPVGFRTYKINNVSCAKTVVEMFKTSDEYNDIDSGIVSVHHKEEKKMKDFLDSLAMEKKVNVFKKTLSTFTRTLRDDNQGDDAWKFDRLGYLTGSDTPFDVTGKEIPTFDNYVAKKATEEFYKRIGDCALRHEIEYTDNVIQGGRKTQMMERGNAIEGEALALYGKEKGVIVTSHGFCNLNEREMGASVDGEALCPFSFNHLNYIEIKSPTMKTFAEYLVNKTQVAKYYKQIQTQLVTMGGKSVDLVIYYPGMKLLIDTVEIDYTFCTSMMETVIRFEKEKKIMVDALMQGREEMK